MAINVADNFSYKGGKPLDARVKYDTIAAMVAVPAADLYDGCTAYVTATKLNYQYDSSNDTDETLGKWREFQAGGGTSDYEDLENKPSINEVELSGDLSASDLGLATSTQLQGKQDKIQQTSIPTASEDLEGAVYQYLGATTSTYTHGHWYECVSDGEDPATYSWVEAPNYEVMTESDMDDVVTPLPSTQKGYHKYSTAEQVVGEWIDGKKLYERTIDQVVTTHTTGGKDNSRRSFTIELSSIVSDLDTMISAVGYIDNIVGTSTAPNNMSFPSGTAYGYGSSTQLNYFASSEPDGSIYFASNETYAITSVHFVVIVQYTKSTD